MPGPADDFIVPTKYAAYSLVPVGAPASLVATEVMMLTGYFFNPAAVGGAPVLLTVTDGNDRPIVIVSIPSQTPYPFKTELTMFTGLKWGADGVLYGELLGYPTV